MALITTPCTLNDGSADHVYESQGQIPDSKAIVARYFEPAASVGAQSRINVKGDIVSTTLERKLIQKSKKIADSEGVLRPVTWNITATFAKTHGIADVVAQGTELLDLVDPATLTKLCQGYT